MSSSLVAGFCALSRHTVGWRELFERRRVLFGAALGALGALTHIGLEAPLGEQLSWAAFYAAAQFAALLGGVSAVAAAFASGLLAHFFFASFNAPNWASFAVSLGPALLTAMVVAGLSGARPREPTRSEGSKEEAWLRALREGGLVGAFRWDARGGVTDADDEFLRMVGYGRDDLDAGRIDWRKSIHLGAPDDRLTLDRLCASGDARFVEAQFIRKDGGRSRLRLRFVARDEACAQGFAYALDLGAAQEPPRPYADRSTSIERWAVGLAHEINQPLTAATAYLQAARRHATLGGCGRAEALLGAMDRAGAQLNRAARLVGEWRDALAHGEEPQPRRLALHELIGDAWKTVSRRAETSVHAELRLRAERDLVCGDRSQIENVLVDLLRRAAEAASASSRPGLIVVTSSSGDEIAVDIRTAGAVSADPPAASRLGDGGPDEGADPTFSRAIVEAHHGRFSSRTHGGAAFELSLPLAAEVCG
ncbi:hypothetical protein [Methylosinus sp. Ce-a6]|uniref:hypothetical protein n=1 Tax=Methylosinus sp. Ce-a6 TaxID=2172005 RepID=UPI001357AFA9|nr:hypothetical protein [Methylosinus sp. Ce-a6]